ncbi:MAG: extracellular solute-binding protein [Oscillospiraceae bacterium]|jgi:arabinogalactan oligomer/maltooligosaccharide transport system substrate-binding protein|nr:extracellular solute-binding protein [Oscillospiraceae bacterium]
MKRTLPAAIANLLVIALVIVIFSGAFSGAAESAGEVSGRFDGVLEENTTLRILENDTAIKQGYFDALLTAFNAQYAAQGITAVDANMDSYLDLEQDGPYGYGPDVIYQANDQVMKYTDGNHILPLPVEQLDCYAQTAQTAWDAYTIGDGQYYGVPVNVQAPVLYYRKDLLPANWETDWDDDSNGTPDMLEDWGAMYRFSQQIKTESGGTKFGYMKSLYDTYFASGYLFSYGAYVFGPNNDTSDVGFAAGNAEIGAGVIRQLAGVMNEGCIDDTITVDCYSRLASGEYFATMTTPDLYTMFIRELQLVYTAEGLSEEDALAKAAENLGTATVPALPENGDLSDETSPLIPCKAMGGINGYAISSYTKAPDACLAFIDFATSFEMLLTRNEMLGIVPARSDAANSVGGLTGMVNQILGEGNLVIMPSSRALQQVWTPMETLLSDIAKDPFRPESEIKYPDLPSLKAGLEKADQQIYDAIWTLS